jgi:hypothetical protein
MSGGFDDQRADEAFIQIAKLVAGLRDNRPELQSIELAYGLLQVCACMEDSGGMAMSFCARRWMSAVRPMGPVCRIEHGDDPMAATRRAIVMAATARVRRKPPNTQMAGA